MTPLELAAVDERVAFFIRRHMPDGPPCIMGDCPACHVLILAASLYQREQQAREIVAQIRHAACVGRDSCTYHEVGMETDSIRRCRQSGAWLAANPAKEPKQP